MKQKCGKMWWFSKWIKTKRQNRVWIHLSTIIPRAPHPPPLLCRKYNNTSDPQQEPYNISSTLNVTISPPWGSFLLKESAPASAKSHNTRPNTLSEITGETSSENDKKTQGIRLKIEGFPINQSTERHNAYPDLFPAKLINTKKIRFNQIPLHCTLGIIFVPG